jgi:hypothetical protein
MCQPPNSPDYNVLDLGLFHSLQRVQQKNWTSNIETLIGHVNSAYCDMSATSLNAIFLTLQKIFETVLEKRGGNNYKLPCVGKKKMLQVHKIAPVSLNCDETIYRNAVAFANKEIGNEELVL